VDISGLRIVEPNITEEHETSTEIVIKGNTTFGNLLDWGIPEEEIEVIIGEKLPATVMTIRDFASQKGLDFGHIKAPLQAKLDALGAK